VVWLLSGSWILVVTLLVSASVSLSPGQRTDVSLSVVLPPASGNYQWRIIAINSATGNQDDERTVLVQVVTYTPVFYIAPIRGILLALCRLGSSST